MLNVAVVLSAEEESRAPAKGTGVAIVREPREETAEVQMEFGARWEGIDCEGQKAVVETNIGDRKSVERKWQKGEMPFLELRICGTKAVSTSGWHRLSRSISPAEDAKQVLRKGAVICIVYLSEIDTLFKRFRRADAITHGQLDLDTSGSRPFHCLRKRLPKKFHIKPGMGVSGTTFRNRSAKAKATHLAMA
jgi:hypothetical protein